MGGEVESGLGQEALEEAGPVLHPAKPHLDQRGQLADVVLDEVGQGSFRFDQTGSVGLSQCMDRCASGCEHAGYRQGGAASAGRVGRTAAGTLSGGRGGGAGIFPG
jgi:hypothetical protein